MQSVYNRPLFTYINLCNPHRKPLHPLCSWSGYWRAENPLLVHDIAREKTEGQCGVSDIGGKVFKWATTIGLSDGEGTLHA